MKNETRKFHPNHYRTVDNRVSAREKRRAEAREAAREERKARIAERRTENSSLVRFSF